MVSSRMCNLMAGMRVALCFDPQPEQMAERILLDTHGQAEDMIAVQLVVGVYHCGLFW